MRIVKANETHVNAIFNLEKACFDDFYSEKTILADIKNNNNIVFVAIDGDKIVGYIDVFYIFDEANLVKIAVLEQYRRTGIATQLLTRALNYLKKHDVTKMYLEVSEKNKKAIDFYTKNQFEATTKRERYYNDLSDAIIMWKYF